MPGAGQGARTGEARKTSWGWGVLAALLAVGLTRAVALAWVADDAFISIRYAENLLDGHGLVYNAGERVEGYTNLLWTLALAGAAWAGLPVVAASQWLGIAAYAALVACLANASWQRRRRRGVFLPLAAAVVCVADDFHVWASGGLETMLFTALAVQGLLLTRGGGTGLGRPLAAGGVFSLLVLTRPDGLLFAAAGLAATWLLPGTPPSAPDRRARRLLATAVPLGATLAALLAFKLAYYGELLPTAFYSKSVLRPYPSQGLVYLGLYLAKSWYLLPALLAALFVLARSPHRDARCEDAEAWLWLATAGLFVAYLVHVGGDFMFARRLVPALPFLLLALEDVVARRARSPWRTALAAACVVAAALPIPLYDEGRLRIRGVADERRFYTQQVIEVRRRQAELVGDVLAGLPVRVVFEGGMCVFGYYSRLPYLVEMTGLTQYSLARLPLARRGYIGHEKRATDAWLSENGIHLVIEHRFPPIEIPPQLRFDEIHFGNLVRGRIHRYEAAVLDPLRDDPRVRFTPIEQVIARTRRTLELGSLGEAESALERLDRYYLRGAGARGRALRQELRALLATRRSPAR